MEMRTELKERRNEFESWLRHEKDHAETTAKRYASCIPPYLTSVGKLRPSQDEAQAYRKSLMQQGYASSTVRNNLFAIEHYHDMVENPIELSKPSQRRPLPEYLSRAEAQELLFACEDPRDYALLHVLLYGALRASETANLRLRDWDPEERTLRIRDAKGAKDRLVILSKKAASALGSWIEERGEDTGALFPSQRGGNLGRRQVLRLVKKYAKLANLDRLVTAHMLRHTFATHALREGMSVTDLQAQLGHNHPKTTLIYTQVVTERRREAYDDSAPKF